ncbi:hypothetical protein [Paraburkholderia tropica]|uniref:hypothetical protein n=1 Tax=Paraburkholderia tropica TaxID=92647 RepID=UPI003D287FE5
MARVAFAFSIALGGGLCTATEVQHTVQPSHITSATIVKPQVLPQVPLDEPISSRLAGSLQAIATAEEQIATNSRPNGLSVDKWYPMIVSTLALLISGCLGVYTLRKDGKARRQSISDDYWLRKVVSPVAIEPTMKFILDSAAKLPCDCGDANFSITAIDAFLTQYQTDHLAQATNLQALGLLSGDLYTQATSAFDDIEDSVISFCSDNRQQLKDSSGSASHGRGRAADMMREKLNEMLLAVRNYQIGVK